MPDTEPGSTDPSPTLTPEPLPTCETATVGGKTRAQYEAELRKEKGDAWMEAHRGHLDRQWEYMVQTFAD